MDTVGNGLHCQVTRHVSVACPGLCMAADMLRRHLWSSGADIADQILSMFWTSVESLHAHSPWSLDISARLLYIRTFTHTHNVAFSNVQTAMLHTGVTSLDPVQVSGWHVPLSTIHLHVPPVWVPVKVMKLEDPHCLALMDGDLRRCACFKGVHRLVVVLKHPRSRGH